MKKKNTIWTVIVVVIAGAIGSFVGKSIFTSSVSFDEQLMKVAEELNKNCPMMIDQDTQLDNVLGGPGNRFMYNYTIINYTKDELDINTLKSTIRPNIVNNIKTNPDLENFRSNEVTMVYDYKDKNGIHLFRIEVKSDEYKE